MQTFIKQTGGSLGVMGIYTGVVPFSSSTRLAQTPTFATTTGGLIQVNLTAPTLLVPGFYYLALSLPNGAQCFATGITNQSFASLELSCRNANVAGGTAVLPATLSGFSRSPDSTPWIAIA
jgi:hypothetical protein